MIRSPIFAIEVSRRVLELLEQAGLAALAALLELEGEVVQPLGRELVVVDVGRLRLGGGPVVGRGRVRVGPPIETASSMPIPAASSRSPSAVGSAREAGRLAGGLGERLVDVGRVVELDELGRGLDDLGLGGPLAGGVVEVPGPAAERQVGAIAR